MREPGIVPALCGAPLHDPDGLLVGTVEDLLVDGITHRPVWLVVRLAHDGVRRTLVPAARSRPTCRGRRTAWSATAVQACPVTMTGATPRGDEALALVRHYGLGPGRLDACVPVHGAAPGPAHALAAA
jgi:hypothetical protein